ncbi:coadhesin-like [Montipora capricornis]|uniref:coadhesin-like n=1 Tax=Montipora capricornis TaxID=246305 RepID=UPI0035F12973
MSFLSFAWKFGLTISILVTTAEITRTSAAACTSLIANNGNVKFSASSSSVGPGFPHVNSSDVWCAGVIDDEQYLKVDLGLNNLFIDQVVVQGMSSSNRSVTQYCLKTCNDNQNFVEVFASENRYRPFFGPLFDGDRSEGENISTPIQARYVMFNPQEPMIQSNNHLCMRVDILSCQNAPSPVDGGLSEWSVWSPCPGGCNYITTRSRTCTNPAPAFGGKDCSGHTTEDQHCPGSCSAPVDGAWSSWGAWSACSKSCGAGESTRDRLCNNPPPANNGNDCPGNGQETKDCLIQNCTTGNYTAEMSTASPTTSPNSGSQGGQLNIPDIDLVVAISVTSNDSNQTYNLVKNTLKEFIDKYGVDKVHYSIILYGDLVIRVVNFNRTFPPSADELKASLDAQAPLDGGSGLVDALQETSRIFNETMGRLNAIKALVVITDGNFTNNEDTLSTAVRPLEDEGVLVISVAIGAVTTGELLVISPNPLDVILANNESNPLALADNIMDRILRVIPEIDVGFAITGTSIASKFIFNLKLQTIEAINQRYRGYNVRFSVIVYGSVAETRLSLDNAQIDHSQLIADVSKLDPVSLDLRTALVKAEHLFRSLGRPGAKKVFVVMTDTGNDNEVLTAGDILRRRGIILLSINHSANVMNSVTISHIDYLGTPTAITDRPAVIAETIIYKALQVNIPLLDLTFAISATSAQADSTIYLIRKTINSIVLQYGVSRIHYSVIFFGSVATTFFDFSDAPPNQDDLIRQVSFLPKSDGSPDLVEGLKEAKRVYDLQEVRPNARRFLVVIMDNASVSNENALKVAVTELVNNSIFIIGVGIGSGINRTDLDLITREVQHTIIVGINKSPGDLAEEILNIIDLGMRTAGFSNWGWWSACSKTCLSLGIAGIQTRTRFCINPALGCEGVTVETRECNAEKCQGCPEIVPNEDSSYQASSATDFAPLARLNSSYPGLSEVAWCPDPDDSDSYVQINLGVLVLTTRVATKGHQKLNAFVTSFFVSLSSNGSTFSFYEEDGARKEFTGNTNPTSVVFNNLNSSGPVQYVRFHPISFEKLPCMQVSVFGCAAGRDPGGDEPFTQTNGGTGLLIALWVLAGVLSLLLLLACSYYCCWHVCCARGKKKKGLTYLIDDDVDNRWIFMPSATGSPHNRVRQSEIQEVTVEMAEESGKPSGIIHFGIEANETKEEQVTPEAIHSEVPVYSEDVLAVNSNASTLSMSSNNTENMTSGANLKRVPSSSRSTISRKSSNSSESSRKSGYANSGFKRSFEWLAERGKSSIRTRGKNMARFQNPDELETVDYDMFENSRGTAEAGEMDIDVYETMDHSSRGNATGTIEGETKGDRAFVNQIRSETLPGVEEQEIIFSVDGGDRNMYILEEWKKAMGGEGSSYQSNAKDEPLYYEVGAQLSSDNDPTYSEVGSQIKAEDESEYSVVGSQL